MALHEDFTAPLPLLPEWIDVHHEDIGLVMEMRAGNLKKAFAAAPVVMLVGAVAMIQFQAPPELLLLCMIPLLWPIAMILQRRVVVASPAGIEVSFRPFPWPSKALNNDEILSIAMDNNAEYHVPERRHRRTSFNLFSSSMQGGYFTTNPSVDAVLHRSLTHVRIVTGVDEATGEAIVVHLNAAMDR